MFECVEWNSMNKVIYKKSIIILKFLLTGIMDALHFFGFKSCKIFSLSNYLVKINILHLFVISKAQKRMFFLSFMKRIVFF